MAKTLRDLIEEASRGPERMRLLSVRLPVDLIQRTDELCEKLRCGKGEIVTALLLEGLARVKRRA